MADRHPLIAPAANPWLERAIVHSLGLRCGRHGGLGRMEALALRVALVQNTVRPQLLDPQVLLFAADHGLAVDGVDESPHSTAQQVQHILDARSPLAVFARQAGAALTVVDAGVCERLAGDERLLTRKIAHGTRNSRVGPAMGIEQLHGAIRAGMDVAAMARGNVFAFAGIGVGARESAALVISRLADVPVRELLCAGPRMPAERLAHLLLIAQAAQARHREATDPLEALSALGGFETAMMAGAMLACAARRYLMLVDGMAACAALLAACRIAPEVAGYAVFARSRTHRGLERALALFEAQVLQDLDIDSVDGSAAALALPLVRSAVALLADGADGEDEAAGLESGLRTSPAPLVAC
jgi:nicotinate-nucleotide--dimethylbenzimidazole phosphoribosyltransferase